MLIAADALFISLALWLSFWLRLVHSFNANFLQSLELLLDDAPGLWRRDSNVIPIQLPQILRERFGANLMQEWC